MRLALSAHNTQSQRGCECVMRASAGVWRYLSGTLLVPRVLFLRFGDISSTILVSRLLYLRDAGVTSALLVSWAVSSEQTFLRTLCALRGSIPLRKARGEL